MNTTKKWKIALVGLASVLALSLGAGLASCGSTPASSSSSGSSSSSSSSSSGSSSSSSAHEHTYNQQATTNTYLKSAATCTDKAVYYYSCTCGAKGTETFEYGEALGHNFVNGVCSRCGERNASEGLEFELSKDGTYYSVTGIGNCTDTGIAIPSTYEGKPVTSIGQEAFENCSRLTSITIPNSVTSIGDYAFCKCSSLTSVTIGNSVTSIGDGAFLNCRSLRYNEYDNGYYLGNSENPYLVLVKAKNTSITSWLINDNTKLIYGSAFSNCSELSSITIPNSVTSIGQEAFENCSRLTSITIPNSVTSIGDYAFEYCYRLVEVYNLSSKTITKGGTENGYVGYYALNVYTKDSGESKLHTTEEGYIFYEDGDTVYLIGYMGTDASLTLPDKYNGKNYAIYKYAFYNYGRLKSVTIGNSVTSIGDLAFYGCTNLTSVTIGNSVTSIGCGAFSGCKNLTSVTFKNPNGWWGSQSSTATSGTTIGTMNLSNTSTAAKYLTSTYYKYYWHRS